jgi:periplasmic nitrate reductase NapD
VPANNISRRDLVSLTPRAAASPSDIVHIASLLVQATPRGMLVAKQAAAAIDGAEIHETAAPGKFVVVLESSHERTIADAADLLRQVTGVLTVSVVTHFMESASALEQEV